jgi:hypothetical protein
MGKRKGDRQLAMWVMSTDLPTAASHGSRIRLLTPTGRLYSRLDDSSFL